VADANSSDKEFGSSTWLIGAIVNCRWNLTDAAVNWGEYGLVDAGGQTKQNS